MARDIVNASTDEDLYTVFHNLLTGLAKPMKAVSKLPSVTSSPHSKRLQNVETVAATLDTPETRSERFRNKCFQRDSYRCVVTGDMDEEHWKALGSPKEVDFGPLEAAHIIPLAYASWDKSSAPSNDTASAWEALFRCFPNVRKAGMQAENINDISNGIALRDTIHILFGDFCFAFKPTDSDNVYELKAYNSFPSRDRRSFPENSRVEFTRAEDAQDLELPSPALLDCHYRVAEILNASGLAEVIERYRQDWDDIKGTAGGSLREDGGTDIGQILRAALWERVVS